MKRLALACLAVIATVGLAYSAGNYDTWPLVGGPARCGGFSSGPTGQVCSVTIPAGPAALTGNETIPMDTNLAQGAQPQAVGAKAATLNAGPYQYVQPLTGTSVTVSQGVRQLIIDPAGTIAALTVVFPTAAQAYDNQRIGLCSTQVVTALTMTNGSGTTILNPVTALAIPPATGSGTCYEWIYRAANTSFFRVQ